jgi:hypothetical protein
MKCKDCGSEGLRGFHAQADRPLCPKCFRVHNQQFPRPQTISPPKAKAPRKRRSPEEKAEEFREALREIAGLKPREGSPIGAIQPELVEKVNVDRPVPGAVPKAVVDQRLGELFRQFYEAGNTVSFYLARDVRLCRVGFQGVDRT